MATTSGTSMADEVQVQPMSFNLVIVSPSAGVTGPLRFPHLPAATSVKELKAKIRDVLPSKPADDSQRLIHRGRMLASETETMMDIFGAETLAKPESQTLHLVLKPTGPDTSSTHPSLHPTPNPATPLLTPQRLPVPVLVPVQNSPQPAPANLNQDPPAQLLSPGLQQVAQHQLLHQADHLQNMTAERLQHLQQETDHLQQDMIGIEQRLRALTEGSSGLFQSHQPAGGQGPSIPGPQNSFQQPHGGFRTTLPMPASLQNLINQQQRDRAAEGRHGAQDAGGIRHGARLPEQSSSGRASPNVLRPDHTTTHTREGVGPNGERWHIRVDETTTTFPVAQMPHHHHHHQGHANNPLLDNLQAILRNADRVLGTQHAQDNAEPAGADLVAPNPPSAMGNPDSIASNRATTEPSISTTTPTTTGGSVSSSMPLIHPSNTQVPLFSPAAQSSSPPNPYGNIEPIAYILSSPLGPRALLLNNSDTFYSTRQLSRRRRHDSPAPVQRAVPAANGRPAFRFLGHGDFRERNLDRRRARLEPDPIAQPDEGNPLERLDPHVHANPGPGALAARIGPMVWLIIRLAGFVWFFTAGNNSWTRFFMVFALALGVFIVNTGMFNGVAEQLWGPIRRHVEALIPLAGPQAALLPPANAAVPQHAAAGPPAGDEQVPRRRRGELDPNEVAARLIEQHRQANAGWLMAQIRRAEHAALLFLASLVPGVGERHIAAREAEASAAEAERQRRIEAATAAENFEEGRTDEATEGGSNQESRDTRGQDMAEHAPVAQPLVDD